MQGSQVQARHSQVGQARKKLGRRNEHDKERGIASSERGRGWNLESRLFPLGTLQWSFVGNEKLWSIL
jgi:hypothetical protein